MPVVDAAEGMWPYVIDFVVAHHKNMFGCISHNFHVQHQLSDGAQDQLSYGAVESCSSTKLIGNSNIIVNN